MKTMLFLLLFASSLAAQEPTVLNYERSSEAYYANGWVVVDASEKFEEFILSVLLTHGQAYVQECYNDSVPSEYLYVMMYDSSEVKWDGEYWPDYVRVKKHWNHREPTFQGFIRYIEKNALKDPR